jgi:hypothetical protein
MNSVIRDTLPVNFDFLLLTFYFNNTIGFENNNN